MQIFVFGDTSSSNLGDPILTQSTAFVIEDILKETEIQADVKVIDIVGRKKTVAPSPLIKTEISSNNRKILLSLRVLLKWYLKEKNFFTNRIEKLCEQSDDEKTFVIAGGALFSSSMVYALRLNEIVEAAKKRKINVIFNAIGIENTVKKSISRFYIRKMLKSENVIAFATRDNIDLVSYLTKRKDFCQRIADSGLFSAEAYGVVKKNSNTVGIGVISTQAYRSVKDINQRAGEIEYEDLLLFWHSIIEKLESEGIEWKIFSNGGPGDYALAVDLIEKYGYPKDKLLPRAQTPNELVEQISGFRAILAHRLHSLIIATSLEIPVIPVEWSDKINKFAEMINIQDRVIWPEISNVNLAVSYLSDSDFKANVSVIDNIKENTKEFLKQALIVFNAE